MNQPMPRSRAIFCFGLLVLMACGAHSPRLLDPHYQAIHIPTVKNETREFGLEERMTRALIEAFQRDGQLRVAREANADLILKVRITDALFTPHAFSDLERAVGYRLHLVIAVDAIDRASGESIFENHVFSAEGDFILSNDPPTATSRDVSALLAESVLSYLIEGW